MATTEPSDDRAPGQADESMNRRARPPSGETAMGQENISQALQATPMLGLLSMRKTGEIIDAIVSRTKGPIRPQEARISSPSWQTKA